MTELLEFILINHFGSIILSLSIIIASLLLRNKIAQLIHLIIAQRLQPQCSTPDPKVAAKLNADMQAKETLTEKEFEETFGMPYIYTEETDEKSVPSTEKKEEKEGLGDLLRKAARGEKVKNEN